MARGAEDRLVAEELKIRPCDAPRDVEPGRREIGARGVMGRLRRGAFFPCADVDEGDAEREISVVLVQREERDVARSADEGAGEHDLELVPRIDPLRLEGRQQGAGRPIRLGFALDLRGLRDPQVRVRLAGSLQEDVERLQRLRLSLRRHDDEREDERNNESAFHASKLATEDTDRYMINATKSCDCS